MTLLTLETFYVLAGIGFLFVAANIARDRSHPRRWGSAAFWTLLAVVFCGGKFLPPVVVGYLVLGMVLLAATKQVTAGRAETVERTERLAEAERLGNRVFLPALLVPLTAIAGSLALGKIHFGTVALIDAKQATLIALGLGAVVALFAAWRVTGAPIAAPVREGGRLVETVGWALILPQLLAALGGIFAQAGVGPVLAGIVSRALPTQFPFVAVAAYCFGMLLFTMCMGNAFAAFAVITGGIGLPLVVQQHHGNPAIMAAIGMLSGYCGTLMTPMAANFNIVPAMLLELRDQYAVIKAQIPLGLTIFAANVALMYLCVYRF
jgi:uncharacterized membrane protein